MMLAAGMGNRDQTAVCRKGFAATNTQRVWASVWADNAIIFFLLINQVFEALKSRLVAGFSGAGLAYF